VKSEHGKIDGDLRVREEFALHGMITGTVIVEQSGILHLHGTVCQDLILEQGSRVDLHGMVTGNVLNRGGRLRVFGTITGALRHAAGQTLLDPKAVVRGDVIGSTEVLQ